MTLAEFRKNARAVKAASRLLNDPTFRAALAVVWEEHPMFNPMSRVVGCATDNSAYQLGTIDGANRVIGVLQALGKPLTETAEPKAEYQPAIE